MLSPADRAPSAALIDTDAVAADLTRLRDEYAGREREMRTAVAQRLKAALATGRKGAEAMLLKDRHGRACAERLCGMTDDIIRMLYDLVGRRLLYLLLDLSVITIGMIVLIGALVTLRLRKLAYPWYG